ncbi:MAG: zinc ABC transporter substrate-binding protein [Thaumarchaeota archaeon]|nr:zinc ABC transporter substrate-binding protein [Nitrososphaerota archaeon]
MQRSTLAIVAIVIIILAVGGIYAGLGLPNGSTTGTTSPSGSVVHVVAAENFWGSLASQVGGTHANVVSIVSDPNADPHEYASSSADAQLFADANLVIVNGAGYDAWALSLVAASNAQNQEVLNVQELLKQSAAANPHFWYSPVYVNETVNAMYEAFVSIDPADAVYFHQQYANLNASLWQSYMSREVEIKQQFAGAPVAATEDIFVYMANASGLRVVSPTGFMQAVAEGNDPSAQDVATFQQLLEGGNTSVRVLAYNQQTVTPLAQSIKEEAAQYEIPIIGVTETIQPPDVTFQFWMGSELISLQNALNAQALGK